MVWLCLFMASGFGPTAQALDLKDIQKRGVLRIGVKNNLPLMGLAQNDGTLAGYEIDLGKKLVQTIWGDRLQIEFVPLKNQERLAAVMNGQVDLAIANIRTTASRKRVVHFSRTYLKSSTKLIGFPSNIHSPQSICKSRIGLLQGSIAIGRMISRCPNTKYSGFQNYQSAIKNIENGTIDLFAGDAIALKGFESSKLEISEESMGLSSVAIAMPKGLQHRSLHEAIDLALQTLEDNGELQQMRNIWRLSSK